VQKEVCNSLIGSLLTRRV